MRYYIIESKIKNNFFNKKQNLLKPKSGKKYVGVFKSQENYGFIENTDLYVRWENINSALNKDTVEYLILQNQEDKNKFEAQITKVIERYKVSFIGTIIHKEANTTFVLLDNSKINKVVSTPKSDLNVGSKVKVILENFQLDNLKGKIEKKIGNIKDKDIEITSILEDYGISTVFNEKVEEELKKINLDIKHHENESIRKNYTNIPFVTIDPNESKDYDDAIAVRKEGSDYVLYVAIADVWSYIKNSPSIIKEAENRSTSIYFLNSVIPMLPEKLSNNFCSIIPNEKRCAIVFQIKINSDGKIKWDTLEVNPGIIESKRRLTYEEVNNYFETKKNDFSKEIENSLNLGLNLHKILETKKIEKGYISIDNPELKIEIDENTGKIISLNRYSRGDAQMMIENFMILANEGIAKKCIDMKIPTIFRIHERPEINKIMDFMHVAKSLNFLMEVKDINNIDQKLIASWFQENQANENIEIIKLLLLKSLQKARYSINNLGHYGLNLKNYLHFTSPIRRFSDAMVHKMLWKYVFSKETIDEKDYEKLNRISEHNTNKEIEASEISKAIENIKIIQFLNDSEKIFKAKVIGTTKSGVIVRLENFFIEGFIRSRNPAEIGSFLLVKHIPDTKEFKMIKTL